MHNFGYGPLGSGVPSWLPFAAPFFVVFILWSLFWQALGMWHSARRGQWIWFVVFLLVHTVGILELIYLFGVIKLKTSDLFKK